MPDITTFLQFIVNGVGIGCIYGLVGLGFAIIYNASGILNFAQGAFVMLGGILTYVLLKRADLPLVVAAFLATLTTASLAAIFQIAIIGPLFRRKTPVFIMILATLALSVVIESVVQHSIGNESYSYPAFSPGSPFNVAGVAIDRQMVWIVVTCIVLVGLLNFVYGRTAFGKAMKACAINPEVASLLAIPVERMLVYSFALSAAVGAVAGILITPTQFTAFHIAIPYSVNGFVAALIGGLGNPTGAFLGGVLVGVLQALAVLFLGGGYKEIATFLLLLLFLFLRPNGIFRSIV